MNSEAFIDICEKSLSENKVRLGLMQREIYMEKLRRFTDAQRDKIFDRLLEVTKRPFPKIAEIYESAAELGYLAIDTTKTRRHEWRESACSSCRGEGRVATFWRCRLDQRAAGIVEIQEFVHIMPYSLSGERAKEPNDFIALFRCKCIAGDALTLGKSWPKWSTEVETVREVWL